MGEQVDIKLILDGALKNNKGKLTRKNLEEAAKGLEQSGKKAEAALLTNITYKGDFFEADRNQDGVLDENEIKELDFNEDGKITRQELDYFGTLVTRIGHHLQSIFKQNDGFVSSEDLNNKADELHERGNSQKEAALLRRLAVGDTFGKLAFIQKGRDVRDYGLSGRKIPSKYLKDDLGQHIITRDLMIEEQGRGLGTAERPFDHLTIYDILALEKPAPRP